MIRFIYLIAPLIILKSLSAEVKTDSLETRLQVVSGKEKIEVLNKLAKKYYATSPEKTIEYGQQALELSQKLNYLKGQAISFENIGIGYSDQSDYNKALEYLTKSLKISEDTGYIKGIARSSKNIGVNYRKLSNYDKALEFYLKSLKKYEEIEDKNGITDVLNNIGIVYGILSNYDKALEYFKKSLKMYEETGNKKGISYSLINIGNVYYFKKNYNKALEYFLRSLKIVKEIGNKFGVASSTSNIGEMYQNLGNYDKALEYYLKSLKLVNEIGDKNIIAINLMGIGDLYFELKNYNKSIQYFEQGLKLAKEIGSKDLIKEIYENYSDLFSAKADYKKAFEYYKLYSEVKDSIFTKESGDKIAEMQTKYETEKKEKEIKILTKNKEIQTLELSRQKLFRNLFIIGFAFILILAFVIYNRYRLKTKAHTALTKAHNQLNEAKEVIEEKNDHIMSSIRYAQKIQRAILPVDEKMKEALTDYFVIFKPQAIVSGDFYWFSQINDKIFIAVVDCTGHGVPGAFMSMIGNSLLNKIVNENKIFDPAVIMEQLHNGVRAALKQEGEDVETQDGMDVCLCILENEKKKLTFTGAKRPLYHIYNSELVEIKGDRKSIGGLQKEKKRKFTKNEIDINSGDIIYLTTDGFADQSDAQEKKYGSRRLKEYLQKNAKPNLGEQKEALLAELEAHQGDEAQRDDITILGIRVAN